MRTTRASKELKMILRRMLLISFLIIILTLHIADGNQCLASFVRVIVSNDTTWTNETWRTDGAWTSNDTAMIIEDPHDQPTYRRRYVECPTETDPSSHTECCDHDWSLNKSFETPCCPRHSRRFYEIDNTLATVIAVTVITLCVVLSILAVVCCFWSKCPLYDTCRAHYQQSEVVTLDKEDETMGLNNMPAEPNNKNKHIYAPNNVSSGSAV